MLSFTPFINCIVTVPVSAVSLFLDVMTWLTDRYCADGGRICVNAIVSDGLHRHPVSVVLFVGHVRRA